MTANFFVRCASCPEPIALAASRREVAALRAPAAEPTGTFDCPICGEAHPHAHDPGRIAEYKYPDGSWKRRNSRPVFPYPPGLPSFPSLELQSQVEKDYAREIEKFQRELEAWRNLPSPSRHVESAAPSAAPAPAAFTGCDMCHGIFAHHPECPNAPDSSDAMTAQWDVGEGTTHHCEAPEIVLRERLAASRREVAALRLGYAGAIGLLAELSVRLLPGDEARNIAT